VTTSQRFEAWVQANQWRIAAATVLLGVFLTPRDRDGGAVVTARCRKPYLLSGATDLFCAREAGHAGACAYAREFRPRRVVALVPMAPELAHETGRRRSNGPPRDQREGISMTLQNATSRLGGS
jgi:hypothetical protein